MSKLRDEILKNHNPAVRRRAELEYDVLSAVLRETRLAGYTLEGVFDGEEFVKTQSREEVLRLCFDLDEAWVKWTKDGKRYSTYLVFGNDGWDLVSDHTWDVPEGVDVLDPPPGTFAYVIDKATKPFADRYG